MFPGFRSTRSWYLTGAVILPTALLSWGGAGVAVAESPDSRLQPSANGSSHILGVQAGTATWLMLGMALLLAALVASSRTKLRKVPDASIATPAAMMPSGREPASDIGTPISAL